LTPRIVLDTDFLSAFLKIERLPLIRDLYQVTTVSIPPAVYQEMALTDLLPRLLALVWIHVASPASSQMQVLLHDETFRHLGRGEQEAIALAQEHQEAILLTNDNRARSQAISYGVHAVNIPAFLLACKMIGLLDAQEMARVIADLQEKDHYGFRHDVLHLLLS
jgi:predicted nucleic acid-binding protein